MVPGVGMGAGRGRGALVLRILPVRNEWPGGGPVDGRRTGTGGESRVSIVRRPAIISARPSPLACLPGSVPTSTTWRLSRSRSPTCRPAPQHHAGNRSAAPDDFVGRRLARIPLEGVEQELRTSRNASARPALVRRGVATPLYSLIREGDLLKAQFLDPDLRASLRVTVRKQHVLFEVVDVQPADAEELTLKFPIQRLKTAAGAFNATYDDQFGSASWGRRRTCCRNRSGAAAT